MSARNSVYVKPLGVNLPRETGHQTDTRPIPKSRAPHTNTTCESVGDQAPTPGPVCSAAMPAAPRREAPEARPDLTGRAVLSEGQWRSVAASLSLSPRELQITQEIFDDEKEAAIALKLGLSIHTVHTYLERVYQKLNVASRCGLLLRVFSEHLALRDSAARGSARFRHARGDSP